MRAPEFWSRNGALPTLLAPLGLGYGLGTRLRRALVRPVKLPVPVICVGNLVAGGAGKTPVALACLAALKDRGAHALTRGYGGTAAGPLRVEPNRHEAALVGDEALLLARAAPTWVARDRAAGAQAAVKAGARAIFIVDGFQNPALVKDLSLLVVDGAYGFGNGRLIPAGPLRETLPDGLARADAVILLGADEAGLAERLGTGLPLLRAELAPGAEAAELKGQKIFAFAGIARPEKFFRTLREAGAELAETRGFPDHHPYGAREAEGLLARAETLGARAVTTEKDAVRLPAGLRARFMVLPVTVAWRDADTLSALLDRIFPAGT